MRPLQPAGRPRSGPRRRIDLIPAPLPLPTISTTPSISEFLHVNHSDLNRICRIGSGAACTVYKVVHRPTGVIYALKVLYGNYEYNQIRRQIEKLRAVENPNIVRCLDLLFHNGQLHLILEFVSKGSLEGRHILDEATLSDLSRQILCGVSYLHGLKMVHGHLKPSNLLSDSNGAVKISGVGMPTIVNLFLKVSNSPATTVKYTSPDKIIADLNNGRYDGYGADIWSLGLMILEFYMGKFPIAVGWEECRDSLMRCIPRFQPPEAPATATGEFRDFITCCLQRDPSKRWTAADLLSHPFIAHHATPAPPPPPPPPETTGINNQSEKVWREAEDKLLSNCWAQFKPHLNLVASQFPNRSPRDCEARLEVLREAELKLENSEAESRLITSEASKQTSLPVVVESPPAVDREKEHKESVALRKTGAAAKAATQAVDLDLVQKATSLTGAAAKAASIVERPEKFST